MIRAHAIFGLLVATTQIFACDGKHGMGQGSGYGADVGLDVLPAFDLGSQDLGADVEISGEVSRYLPVTREESHGLATSLVCSDCHATSTSSNAMKDAAGRAIGQFDLWQSTMKANSYRDPFFRAVMSAEVHRNPEAQDVIEQTCLRCHAPAGTVAAERSGTQMSLEAATTQSTVGAHAADGVNCVSCHAIMDVNLGTAASYSGGWELDPNKRVFGPHSSPFAMPMQNRIDFTPVASDDTTLVNASFEGTPASIEVELVYQSLGNRWLRDLFEVPTADVQAFKQMWERIDRRPAIVAAASYP